MNHSLRTADPKTHVRIVSMSLLAGIAVVVGAIHVRINPPGESAKAAFPHVITASPRAVYPVNPRAPVR
jgi:hypothetical protein